MPIDEAVWAPFSDAEVASLNDFQESGTFHPFTCGNRDDGLHRDDGDGTLIARTDGWYCPDCDYTQTWAHKFMTDRSWELLTL